MPSERIIEGKPEKYQKQEKNSSKDYQVHNKSLNTKSTFCKTHRYYIGTVIRI